MLRVRGSGGASGRGHGSCPQAGEQRQRAGCRPRVHVIDATPTPDAVEYRTLARLPGYRVGADGSFWSSRERHGRPGSWRRVPASGAYPTVYVRPDPGGPVRGFLLGRLVCEAWHGPPPSAGAVVRYADGNRGNPSPANVFWHALRPVGGRPRLLTGPRLADARRLRAEGATLATVAGVMGVSVRTLWAALRRE